MHFLSPQLSHEFHSSIYPETTVSVLCSVSMEKECKFQEFKHACKFCNKSFPCGRSLGGHMRSHINKTSSENEQKQKMVSNNNGCIGSEVTYGLRENPKKTWRRKIADSSCEEDKFCKECGKCFHSWNALFGHMKCHSEKEKVCYNSFEDQDSSWTITQKNFLMDDIQSDNEITAPSRKRRSKRTSRTRCMTNSSSVSEVDQEQEEVAMSLVMLSKDLSPWSGFHPFAAESSDNNSVYFEPRSAKFDAKKKNSSTMNAAKLKKCKLRNSVAKKLNFKGKSLEILDLDTENGFKMNKSYKSEVSTKGLIKSTKKFDLDYVSTLEDFSEVENGKSKVYGTESLVSKFYQYHEDEFIKNFNKRGKFECTTCNKIFHSYQALGGHRASHKKTKGCSSKIENGENSVEFETDLSHESKIIKGNHECPICFKNFQSGQALGGHKRSHIVASESTSRVPQIREFLDLNLPAEEESYSHADSNKLWWIVEGNHNQEALLG